MIRVVLCDDHRLMRQGIRQALADAVEIQVTAEAGDYGEVREALRSQPCDVLLLDLVLPGRGGMDVLQALSLADDAPRTLVLSMHPHELYAMRCLRAGAWGYLSKDCAPDELVSAVRTLAQGRKYLTPEVAQMLADSVSRPATEAGHDMLSERELQTLIRIASGKRLSDIASDLMLSPKTVSVYRARVMEKLALRSTAALTTYAIKHHLV